MAQPSYPHRLLCVTRQRLYRAGAGKRARGGRTLTSRRRAPGRRGTPGGTWAAWLAAPTAAPSARPTATIPCSRTTSLRAPMKVTTPLLRLHAEKRSCRRYRWPLTALSISTHDQQPVQARTAGSGRCSCGSWRRRCARQTSRRRCSAPWPPRSPSSRPPRSSCLTTPVRAAALR